MRKIIDSNYLNSPCLEHYFSANRKNTAILCDYAGLEAYKVNSPIDGICDSMSILSKYPKQVLILKNTIFIRQLKPVKAQLQRRMIDDKQTKEFEKFCLRIHAARLGKNDFSRQILEHANNAVAFLESATQEAMSLRSAIIELGREFTASELSALRKNEPWPSTLKQKFGKQLIELVGYSFEEEARPVPSVTLDQLRTTYIFRYVLCCYILTLRWIAKGCPPKNPEKIRNHMFDSGFAAYATYFDGFLSHDMEAMETYKQARAFLSAGQGR